MNTEPVNIMGRNSLRLRAAGHANYLTLSKIYQKIKPI